MMAMKEPRNYKLAAGTGLLLLVLGLALFLSNANVSDLDKTFVFASEASEISTDAVDVKAPVYPPAPQLSKSDYPSFLGINGRIFVWIAAQMHLWFAAFVLAVPIFVFIIEAIGMRTRDKRFDDMAYEFIKISLTAYSLTAIIGGVLLFGLLILMNS